MTHNQDNVLQRLHAAANAPINGIFQNQLGRESSVAAFIRPKPREPLRLASPFGSCAGNRSPIYSAGRPGPEPAVRLARAAAVEYQRGAPAARQHDRLPAADGLAALLVVHRRRGNGDRAAGVAPAGLLVQTGRRNAGRWPRCGTVSTLRHWYRVSRRRSPNCGRRHQSRHRGKPAAGWGVPRAGSRDHPAQ